MSISLLTTNSVTKTIDWVGSVIPYVNQLLDKEYTKFRPTVRGIFYRAGSDEVIPLTTHTYKGLVKALSTARKNGLIPMDAFTDNSRHIIEIDDLYWEPIQFIDDLGKLRHLHRSYHHTIPRWHDQRHYVEVFIEKDAVVGTFQEILKDRQVRIVPNHGWSSITYEYDNIQRLLSKKREGKIVHVLYFGDYDPTGLRMSYNLGQKLQGYGIDFKRVALAKSQIVEFGLDHLKNPDPQVLEKLKRDPNADAFKKENSGLYQIETDALQKDPEKLQKLVLNSIDQYFDIEINKKLFRMFSKKCL